MNRRTDLPDPCCLACSHHKSLNAGAASSGLRIDDQPPVDAGPGKTLRKPSVTSRPGLITKPFRKTKPSTSSKPSLKTKPH